MLVPASDVTVDNCPGKLAAAVALSLTADPDTSVCIPFALVDGGQRRGINRQQ